MAEKCGLYYTDGTDTQHKILYKCKLKQKYEHRFEEQNLLASYIYFYLGDNELPSEMVINCIYNRNNCHSDVVGYLNNTSNKEKLSELLPLEASNSAKSVIYCFEYSKISTNLGTAKEYKIKYDGLRKIERHLGCMNDAFCDYLKCVNWDYESYVKSYSIDQDNKITQGLATKGLEYVKKWYDNLKLIVNNSNFRNDKIAGRFCYAFLIMYNQLTKHANESDYDEALNYILLAFPKHWLWVNGNRKRVRDLAVRVLNPHVHGGVFIRAVIDEARGKVFPPNDPRDRGGESAK